MATFHTLVINLESRADRREVMSSRLADKNLTYRFIQAVEPKNLNQDRKIFLTETAESVWLSHRKCLEVAASWNTPTLILEDDAILNFDRSQIEFFSSIMAELEIDFLQVGYLKINLAEGALIQLKNWYSFFTRTALAANFFNLFGFKEVGRAKGQIWRGSLPKNFIVNDVRFGAHSYLITPKFATQILALNSPVFLPADDFYVALSRAKSFKMIRLRKSLSQQDASSSSFSKRFLLK
jgi:GR25 family glycosyltransferase involved in LPS biosynthesis